MVLLGRTAQIKLLTFCALLVVVSFFFEELHTLPASLLRSSSDIFSSDDYSSSLPTSPSPIFPPLFLSSSSSSSPQPSSDLPTPSPSSTSSPSSMPSPSPSPTVTHQRAQVPKEYRHVMEEWAHLSNETLDVLALMLSQRTDKIRRYANVSKEAHTTLYGIDHRLPFVLRNMRKNLGPEWNITVFHSPINAEWLRSLPEVKEVGAHLSLQMPANFSYENYGNWLLRVDYWKRLHGEILLMFQTDSCMCANTPFKVIDFMDYDYVGAPWGHMLNDCGNGGFSLRRRHKIIEALENCHDPGDYVYEDSFICNCFYHIKTNRANWHINQYFSAETWRSETSIGLHKPGAYYGNSGEEVYTRCPEALEVLQEKKNP